MMMRHTFLGGLGLGRILEDGPTAEVVVRGSVGWREPREWEIGVVGEGSREVVLASGARDKCGSESDEAEEWGGGSGRLQNVAMAGEGGCSGGVEEEGTGRSGRAHYCCSQGQN